MTRTRQRDSHAFRRATRLGVLALAPLLTSACSKSTSGRLHVTPNVVAGQESTATAATVGALRLGSGAAPRLASLKYFFTDIVICQNVEEMGSGYRSAEGCLPIYSNHPGGMPDYEGYGVNQALDDTAPDHYVDLMSAEGRSKLRQPFVLEAPVADDDVADGGASPDGGTPSRAGVYRYGLVNFLRPIKVTAEFPIVGEPDAYYRTRAVTQVTSGRTPDGAHTSDRVQIGDTLSGPTEETTYMLNNGGVLFTFQKPFVIDRADVEAQTEITMDLVFNPESFGQAFPSDTCLSDPFHAICDPQNDVVIDMPYVRMTPVPRKRGEHTRKETYLMDYDGGSQLRIELYYNDADGEASIQGVDTAVVYTAVPSAPENNVVPSNHVSQSGSVTTNDASVTLLSWDRVPALEGLVRRQNGTATLHCLYGGAVCTTPGASLARAYTFVGDTLVSGS